MARTLLPLCSVPTVTMRDGWSGKYARILVPFLGYYFADGSTISGDAGVVQQSQSRTLEGTVMTNDFQKDCCCPLSNG
jgi:hypothetical protein